MNAQDARRLVSQLEFAGRRHGPPAGYALFGMVNKVLAAADVADAAGDTITSHRLREWVRSHRANAHTRRLLSESR